MNKTKVSEEKTHKEQRAYSVEDMIKKIEEVLSTAKTQGECLLIQDLITSIESTVKGTVLEEKVQKLSSQALGKLYEIAKTTGKNTKCRR
jgi:hypothetical protein